MRRGAGLAFMAGMWVFPGGRVDEADASPRCRARARPKRCAAADGCARCEGEPLVRRTMHWRCTSPPAARRSRSPASCWPATAPDGPAATRSGSRRCRRARRDRARRRAVSRRCCEREDLYVDVGPLVYWSHWITPSLEPKRYDTRFFAIAGAGRTRPRAPTAPRLTEHAWVTAGPGSSSASSEARSVSCRRRCSRSRTSPRAHARHGSLEVDARRRARPPTPPVMPRIDVRRTKCRS